MEFWFFHLVALIAALLGLAAIFPWRAIDVLGISAFTDLPVRLAEVDGWSIRYHLSGRGPHVVLLHGIGANLYCWRLLIPLLKPFCTVLAFDLPGFGGSSKNRDATYGLEDQVERIKKLLEHLSINKAYLVGNSMGANIALTFAWKYPKSVLGVSVIAPATASRLVPLRLSARPWLWAAAPTAVAMNRHVLKWIHSRTVSRPELLGDGRVQTSLDTYGGGFEAMRAFFLATESIRDQRLLSIARELKTKVQILWGSRDKLVNRKVIDALEAALEAKDSQVHIGGGHHLMEDEPQWVADKILAFFTLKPD